MKNTKGFELIELMIVIVILCILTAIAVPRFIDIKNKEVKNIDIKGKTNIEGKKFSQDNLYSPDNKLGIKKTGIKKTEIKNLFHAKLMGEMTCEGFDIKLKVYEFCYNGIKYFAIEGGYMAPKMIKTVNGVVFYETCD